VERLAGIQDRHAAAVARGDREAAFRINLDFHRALFSLCGNPFLVEAINVFAQRSHAFRSYAVIEPGYLERETQEHWEMIAAIRRGDRAALVALCRRHLRPAKDAYIAAYRARFPD
jgi:DNA-binding GntR family transcriptional regulator